MIHRGNMTELLYHRDAYLKEFDAEIIERVDKGVILNRSAFYPGGGGQPADVGVLSQDEKTWQLGKVRRQDAKQIHFLVGDSSPNLGVIHCELDWKHRYRLMRTHTAMHILCGVIWRDYGASVTGGNMEPLRGRMDFEFESMHRELVEEIEEKINIEVSQERPVSSRILLREEAFGIPDLIRTKINLLPKGIENVRVVEIEGLDLQADGGTHVANTREVGVINIIDYKSKGKINKRLVVALEE